MNEQESPATPDPLARVLRLLGGKWLAAAVSAAASLGLADALATEPLTLDELAKQLDAQPNSLRRLMRVLSGEGIVVLNRDHRFELTDAGALLQTGALSDLAKFVGSPFSWDPWSNLAHSVRTGEAAFANHYGEGLFDYLEHNEAEAALYHAAIDAFCLSEARALAQAFDFSESRRIVDVGGGQGTLLVEVLSEWGHLTGVLLERPSAAERARMAFDEAGLSDRCESRVGDFFIAIPNDADVCVLKHIIHSWDDATATDLLRRCAEAVGPTSRCSYFAAQATNEPSLICAAYCRGPDSRSFVACHSPGAPDSS